MTRIDAFTHVLPEPFYEALQDRYGLHVLPWSPEFLWAVEKRIDDMDDYGVDKQVLTLAPPPIWQGMDRDVAIELTRLGNDEVRRFADLHPDRFVAVGTIPFVGEEFMEEVDRCIEDLDMAGVQIFTNVDGRPIDGEEFHPLYERAVSADFPIWLHPQLHDWYDWVGEYHHAFVFGWPFDTTLAMSRLVFSGLMERFPDLQVITHHMGGMVAPYAARIDEAYESRRESGEKGDIDWSLLPKKPVSEYYRQFYADTTVGGSLPMLNCGQEFFGADRMVFASDYPFGRDKGLAYLESTVSSLEAMDVDEASRRKIFGENLAAMIE